MGQTATIDATWLYDARSTIAQRAAALAVLIGFFGLWRLDRLWEVQRQIAQDLGRFQRRQFSESISSFLQAWDRQKPRELDEALNAK